MNSFLYARAAALCLLVSNLLTSKILNGQDIQGNVNNYMKAPSVGVLDKFGNVPVGLYTGVPNVSIPVYTIHSKDIEVPITLSYHAGGIKVDEESGRVGLGWQISQGGVIYRTVKGKDDLIYGTGTTPTYFNTTAVDLTEYTPTNFWSKAFSVPFRGTYGSSAGSSLDVNLIPFLTGRGNESIDFQPDEFSVSLPGYAGKFVLDRQGFVVKEHVDNTKIEIMLAQSDRFNTRWVVTTGDGYKYYFNDTERIGPRPDSGIEPEYISAWYLSEIISPSGSKVTFKYVDEVLSLIPNKSNFFEQRNNYTVVIQQTPGLPSCANLTQPFVTLPNSDFKNKRLDAIEFQNGKLKFDYSDRIDKQGEKRLDKIRLIDNGNNDVDEFSFEYSYFEQNYGGYKPPVFDSNDFSNKRLRLDAFVKNGSTNNPQVYKFEYNAAVLPPKYSLSRDHWGYFNGAINNTTLVPAFSGVIDLTGYQVPGGNELLTSYDGANREPDINYMKAFALNKIIYPTGGYTEFEYEAHDYDILKSNYDYEKLEYHWVSKTMNYKPASVQDGGTTKRMTIEIAETDKEADGLVRINIDVQVVKTSNDPAPSSTRTGYFRITDQTNYIYKEQKLNDINDYITTGTSPYVTLSTSYALVPGTYYIDLYLAENIDWINFLDLECKWIQRPETFIKNTKTKTAGGLRVKRISDYDNITRKSNVRRFQYGVSEDGGYHSYGRLMAIPRYYDYKETLATQNTISDNVIYRCVHFLLSASSNYDLFSGAGVAVGYDTVITFYENEGNIVAKSMNIYNNHSDDVISYFNDQHPAGLPNHRDPLNGTLKMDINYKLNPSTKRFEVISENEYTYAVYIQRPTYGMFWRNNQVSGSYTIPPVECFFYPSINSVWLRLDKIKQKTYSEAGVLTKEVTNGYDVFQSNYKVKTEVTRTSDDRVKTVEYYYASDFLSYPGDTKALIASQANFLNAPIEVVTKMRKNNVDYVLNAEVYNYDYIARSGSIPAKVFPSSIKKINLSVPILGTKFKTLKTQNVVDPNYVDESQFIFDYNLGLLKSVIRRGGAVTSYIWGYNNEFPIAKCTNVNDGEFFFTGFEDNGTVGVAHTGVKYNLGDYYLSFIASGQRKFQYSFWYLVGGEWKFSGVLNYSGPLSITLGDAIDDVRVYPEDGQISTYSFNPLRGLSSSSDSNDRSIYYDYDATGRVEAIKDDNRDIVNRYFYHFQELR